VTIADGSARPTSRGCDVILRGREVPGAVELIALPIAGDRNGSVSDALGAPRAAAVADNQLLLQFIIVRRESSARFFACRRKIVSRFRPPALILSTT
jgi:hypothetical protein